MSKIVSSRIGVNLFDNFKKLVGRKDSSASKVIEEIIEEELVEEELGIDPVALHKAHTKLKENFVKSGKIIVKQIKDIKSLEEELEYSKDLIADLEENLSIADHTNYDYEQEVDALEDKLEYSKELIVDLEKSLSDVGQLHDVVKNDYQENIEQLTIQRTKSEEMLVQSTDQIEKLKKKYRRDCWFGLVGLVIALIFLIFK